MRRDVLGSELTSDEIQALQNKRTGMLIFQLSWIMAFVSMVVINWQLSYSKEWLPDDQLRVSGLPGAVASLALLASVVLAQQGLDAIRRDDRARLISRWVGMLGLGAVFVLIMLVEWVSVTVGSQYAQVFRLMTGFHMIHALVIGAYMLGTLLNARQGQYHAQDYWAVEAGVKLWYFVFIAWMLFYVVLYWIAW